MNERWVRIAAGVVRFVLVVVAFAVALGSIGLSAARGFCPEGTELGALRAATLADVAPDDDGSSADPAAPTDPSTPAPDAPTDAPTDAPAEDAGGACAGGVQRCLPPLVSSVVIFGDGTCHDEAGGRLRSILVPAFVGSTVLLAAAWYLRPERLLRVRDAITSST